MRIENGNPTSSSLFQFFHVLTPFHVLVPSSPPRAPPTCCLFHILAPPGSRQQNRPTVLMESPVRGRFPNLVEETDLVLHVAMLRGK